MRKEWFREMVIGWNRNLKWSERDLGVATRYLMEISTLNGGKIVWDCPEDQSIAKRHAVEQACMALQARFSEYAQYLNNHIERKHYTRRSTRNDTSPVLDFLEPCELAPALDLNEVQFSGLQNMLGGRKSVAPRRIIKERTRLGGFTNLDQVKDIRGISQEDLETLEKRLYVSHDTVVSQMTHPSQNDFIEEPTFEKYIVMLEDGVRLDRNSWQPEGVAIIQLILTDLRDLAEELALRPSTRRAKVGKLGSDVIRRFHEIDRIERLVQENTFGPCHGAMVSSSFYRDFVCQLLPEAKESVSLAMFFMRVSPEQKYPVNAMIDELIKACQRGVDVRVVMDKDPEDGRHRSRIINTDAFEYLSQNNVSVKYNETSRRLHAKVVLTDRCHVLIGSHNWTAGSIYNYDEKSIYVQSPELYGYYCDWFNALWNELI
jgi:hypothetical protein